MGSVTLQCRGTCFISECREYHCSGRGARPSWAFTVSGGIELVGRHCGGFSPRRYRTSTGLCPGEVLVGGLSPQSLGNPSLPAFRDWAGIPSCTRRWGGDLLAQENLSQSPRAPGSGCFPQLVSCSQVRGSGSPSPRHQLGQLSIFLRPVPPLSGLQKVAASARSRREPPGEECPGHLLTTSQG